jgi:large subunit ribosomal protein L13
VEANSYKTIHANAKTVTKNWVIIDAKDQILGRLSSRVAVMLRGKHKANFTPHVDCGDNVIVINCEKVKLTGKKWTMKEYVSYTGYPGGQRHATPIEKLKKNPAFLVEHAVSRMLPKTKLGKELFRNLHVYAGTEHPHTAQKPQTIKLP